VKNYFFLLLICFNSGILAQGQSNRFLEEEHQTTSSSTAAAGVPGGPGSDNDDGTLEDDDITLGIDDYLPLLVVLAVGIIVVKARELPITSFYKKSRHI